MTDTATVETLTAEVRCLMVGNRQVTMSVFNQLDWSVPALTRPLGRVNAKDGGDSGYVVVVGADTEGVLVRSKTATFEELVISYPGETGDKYRQVARTARFASQAERLRLLDEATDLAQIIMDELEGSTEWERAKTWTGLPLIVLAGLR